MFSNTYDFILLYTILMRFDILPIFLLLVLLFREGTEDTKFKLKKKKIYQSKSHPWIPGREILTIREFIDKIQRECPNAEIEIIPLSCTEGDIDIIKIIFFITYLFLNINFIHRMF